MSLRKALANTHRGLSNLGGPSPRAGDAPEGFAGFADRRAAGRQLAKLLQSYAGQDVLVIGIVRGGVAVALEIARSLGADLDWIVARKVGAPTQPELALGAVTADGALFTNSALVRELGVSRWLFRLLADEQRAEARRHEQRLRGRRPAPRLAGRTVFLVDDGLATGATMRAAIRSVRQASPARLVVAVPVAASSACESLRAEADELICVLAPEPFFGVGAHYADFSPVHDAEVQRLLAEGARPAG
ncbi:MAG: phosphoribosyltransferase [Chloroflexota bacterium]|nr:phosphoribosyltransferase [Chloroflexota bacterium]